MMHRLQSALLFALVAIAFAGASPARAELVVLTDGNTLKVTGYETSGELAWVTLSFGGRMTLPIERIERVIDDEVVPAPPVDEVEQAVAEAPSPPIPLRFSEDQPVPEGPYGALIYEAAKRHSVNPQIIAALIRQESAGRRKAVSHKGARGLMQLMPATAKRFGVNNSFDPEQNIYAGTKYLRWLLDKFEDNADLAVAGYNAGEGNIKKYDGVPPFRETVNYINRIARHIRKAIESKQIDSAGAAAR